MSSVYQLGGILVLIAMDFDCTKILLIIAIGFILNIYMDLYVECAWKSKLLRDTEVRNLSISKIQST